MQPSFLLFAILSVPALDQTIIGTVQKIDMDQLQVKGPDGLIAFRIDDKSTVAKLKRSHDLSLLAVGDEVRVNYYGEGTLTAVNISAKVRISGTIAEKGVNHLTLLLDLPADGTSADRKASVFVFLNSTAKLGTSRSQLAVGRRIHVTGWAAGDAVVDADKVTFYDAESPLRPAP